MTEPTPPFRVRAIADYAATSASEISLVLGQEYDVTATDGRGVWWQSYVNGVVGWFPASYTQQIASPAPAAAASPAPMQQQQTSANYGAASTAGAVRPTSQSVSVVSTSPAMTSPGDLARKQSMAIPITRQQNEPKQPRPAAPVKQHIEKNKKNLPTYLKLQIVEARGLKVCGDVKKTTPTAFVFMRSIQDKDDIGRKFESTATIEKTIDPKWNELFQMVVTDAETETVVIRFVSGKKYDKKDTKNFLGEVSFPLRGAVRDFDAPNYQYKWYNLSGPGAVGKVSIYIEYFDSRVTSAPTNVQRVGHIGLDANGQFDVSSIPPELKRLFQSVGIKKSDLKDQAFAKTVFNAIDQYEKSGGDINATAASLASGMAPAPAVPAQSGYQQTEMQQQQDNQMMASQDPNAPLYQTGPDGQQWVWDPATQQWYDAAAYEEYQRQLQEYNMQLQQVDIAQQQADLAAQEEAMAREMAALNNLGSPTPSWGGAPEPITDYNAYGSSSSFGGAPVPPPLNSGVPAAPAPPPAPIAPSGGGGGGGPPPPPPPPPAGGGVKAPPPPKPTGDRKPAPAPAPSDGRDNLLASIRGAGGAGILKKAEHAPPPPAPAASSGGGDLTSILTSAMLAHRKAHSDANDAEEDDWGDDDW